MALLFSTLGPLISYHWHTLEKKFNQYPFTSHGKWSIKPLFECAAALENCREEEVQEGPEFRELILQRGPSQEDSPGGHIVSVQDLSQLAVVILHSVAFVHYHVFPPNL